MVYLPLNWLYDILKVNLANISVGSYLVLRFKGADMQKLNVMTYFLGRVSLFENRNAFLNAVTSKVPPIHLYYMVFNEVQDTYSWYGM